VGGGEDEAVAEADGSTEGEPDWLGVPLAEPPMDCVVVGEGVFVEERLAEGEPLSLPEGVWLGVGGEEPDAVPEHVCVAELVGVDDRDDDVDAGPKMEELAPIVTDDVGDHEGESERIAAELAAGDGVLELVCAPEGGGPPPPKLDVPLGVIGALGPTIPLTVGVGDGESEEVPVLDAETDGTGVSGGVGELVGEADSHELPEATAEDENKSDCAAELVVCADPLSPAEALNAIAVPIALPDAVAAAEIDGLSEPVDAAELDAPAVLVAADALASALAAAEALAATLALTPALPLGLATTLALTAGLSLRLELALTLALLVTAALALALTLALGLLDDAPHCTGPSARPP
jgi:hypothetical protein